MQYKAIIFDFFDVICRDPYRVWRTNHGIENEGEVARLNDAVDRGDIAIEQFYAGLARASGQTPEAVAAEQEAALQIDEDIVRLLQQLKASYNLALISNTPADFIRQLLTEHQLETYFDHMAISAELRMIKPSPEIFLHTLNELGVNPEETIFIDDNPANIKAAEALGLTGIRHTDAKSLRQELHKLGIINEA